MRRDVKNHIFSGISGRRIFFMFTTIVSIVNGKQHGRAGGGAHPGVPVRRNQCGML